MISIITDAPMELYVCDLKQKNKDLAWDHKFKSNPRSNKASWTRAEGVNLR